MSVKREDRAIAGLSMGGAETLTLIEQPDKWRGGSFSGAFGGAGPADGAGGSGGGEPPAIIPDLSRRTSRISTRDQLEVSMIWIVCERPIRWLDQRQFKTWLTSKGSSALRRGTDGARVDALRQT